MLKYGTIADWMNTCYYFFFQKCPWDLFFPKDLGHPIEN